MTLIFTSCVYSQNDSIIGFNTSKNIKKKYLLPENNSSLESESDNDSLYTLEEIKVTSFFPETDIFSSPSSIYTLDKEAIGRINARDAAGILNTVPGILIKDYGQGNSLKTVSMNGLGAEHILVLLNGVSINSVQNSQTDLSLIPVSEINRIEVMNNGYSSLYGSDALGGVINIITKSGINEGITVSTNTSFGSFNTSKLLLNAAGGFGKFYINAAIGREKSDNAFPYYYNSGSISELKTRKNSAYIFGNYSLTADYIPAANLKFRLYSSYVNSDKELPGIETGNEPPYTTQQDKNLNNIFTATYAKNNFIVSNETNFQNNLMNYSVLPYINSFFKNIVISNRTGFSFNLGPYSSVSGIEYKYSTLNSNEVESAIRKQISLFSSNTFSIGKLIIYPSLRYDYISDVGDNVITYKLGFNYKPFENIAFNLRGNYGSNYTAPSFNSLYWKTGGNPYLHPETSRNLELGYILSGGSVVSFLFDFSYLNINTENRIQWLPGRNFIWTPRNVLTSRSDILNALLKIRSDFGKHISASFEIAYTINKSVKTSSDFPEDPTEGKRLIYIPERQVKSTIQFSFKNGGINIFYSLIGKRYTDAENSNYLPNASVLDGNIYCGYGIGKIYATLKLDINNITNTDYQVVSGYPVPLRNFLITLNLKFAK